MTAPHLSEEVNLTHIADTWYYVAKHEPERAARQRAAAANRRAAALKAGRRLCNTQAEAAEMLGISTAAYGQAIKEAEGRVLPPPMADYIELDLPETGAETVTETEYQALDDEQEQVEAARGNVVKWSTMSWATRHLGESCCEVSDLLAVELTREPEPPWAECRQRLTETLPEPWRGQVMTRDHAYALMMLMADMAGALGRHSWTASTEADRWKRRDPAEVRED